MAKQDNNAPFVIHRFRAQDKSGKKAQYFVLMEKAKEPEFLKAVKKSGDIDLKQFGRVIASFYGDKPPAEVTKLLSEKYGFKF